MHAYLLLEERILSYKNFMLNILVKYQNSAHMFNEFQCRIPLLLLLGIVQKLGVCILLLGFASPLHLKTRIADNF